MASLWVGCSLTKGGETKYHQNINTFRKYQQNINHLSTKYQQIINLKNSINILSTLTSTKHQHINLLSTQILTKNQSFVIPFCCWWNIYFMIMPPIWIENLVPLLCQPDINTLSASRNIFLCTLLVSMKDLYLKLTSRWIVDIM